MAKPSDFEYDDEAAFWKLFVQIIKSVDEEFERNREENTGLNLKQRIAFNYNTGKRTKREFKREYGGEEWGRRLKLESKRFTGKKTKREFKEEDVNGDGEWESGVKPKLKRSKTQKPPCPIPTSTPDLPHRFKRHISENMGGSGLVLVIQKALFFSDVNPTASRLSIPFSQIKTHHFLKTTEADALANQTRMEACLLDPSMEKTTIILNRWEMGRTSLYVMTESWNTVVKSNKLKKGDLVQLWSFRVNSNLCFALVKV